MSNKKSKVIHVDHLIIHAKNVEIIDPENVKINRGGHEEPTMEETFPRRDPWGFFWGPPPGAAEREQERQSLESSEQRHEHDGDDQD
ncbi:hypothetical protein [Neobacillus muris]|uniref:hypothetical protein n=1 Tax=Neobacillus muris TaxID=2941334 RepID=UPI00203CA555|nr:hypothetical protein [Neobacillus muris]